MSKSAYVNIWDECYQELSFECRCELDAIVGDVILRMDQHETNYNISNDSHVNANFAEAGAKELLIALMVKGYL